MTTPPDRYLTFPKRQGKNLYMERLLDALHGRNVTYVCQNKQEAVKVKREIEAVDEEIRKEFGI